jgi:tetratricopeptide (TPR) repeat protein
VSPAIRAALLAPALLAAGCASGIGRKVDRLPDDAPARGYVLVPRPVTLPRSRLTADCGPEAFCALLNYWGKPGTVQEISRLARLSGLREGMFSNNFPLLARQKGLHASLVEGSVGRLKKAVDREVPPIVMVASGGGNFHYFVVTGYSDREQVVVCEEYENSKRLLPYGEIEEIWKPAGHAMFEIERTTADRDYDDAADLESKGRAAEAAPLYRRALEADPGHYEARLGLANCLLSQGKPEEALREYREAYRTNPADPRVLNNLANVLLELKRETAEAEALAGQAVERLRADLGRARQEVEREPEPALRALRKKEMAAVEWDLADGLGTLGQARAANGGHAPAIAAWRASLDHTPLTEFDARARRLYEMALSCRELRMPAQAREHLSRALAEARDPALRARIEAALR